jgi:hypothetical protein
MAAALQTLSLNAVINSHSTADVDFLGYDAKWFS